MGRGLPLPPDRYTRDLSASPFAQKDDHDLNPMKTKGIIYLFFFTSNVNNMQGLILKTQRLTGCFNLEPLVFKKQNLSDKNDPTYQKNKNTVTSVYFVGISRFPAVCFLCPGVLKQTPGAQLRPVIRELLLGG